VLFLFKFGGREERKGKTKKKKKNKKVLEKID